MAFYFGPVVMCTYKIIHQQEETVRYHCPEHGIKYPPFLEVYGETGVPRCKTCTRPLESKPHTRNRNVCSVDWQQLSLKNLKRTHETVSSLNVDIYLPIPGHGFSHQQLWKSEIATHTDGQIMVYIDYVKSVYHDDLEVLRQAYEDVQVLWGGFGDSCGCDECDCGERD